MMTQILTAAPWGAAVAAYIAMLLLTERCASRYVSGHTSLCSRSRTFVVTAGHSGPSPSVAPVPAPAFARSDTADGVA
jgi:hypothetical protein